MKRSGQIRSFQSRLPAVVRRYGTQLFLVLRERRRSEVLGSGDSNHTFLTWPPVRNACDLRDLITRLQWFLPRRRFDNPVRVSVSPRLSVPESIWSEGTEILDLPPQEKTKIQLVGTRLDEGSTLLIWKLIDAANLKMHPHIDRWFVIDPDWFALVEELEWMLLYERFKDDGYASDLQQISKLNFHRLREEASTAAAVNVCGSGPSVRTLLERPRGGALNIISNTAVQSMELVDHLKPSVIAFANGVFFGPSDFARKVLAAAERCVRDYGSVVVVPDGFAHYLIASNYPSIAHHTLGLKLGSELRIPSEAALEANRSSNVATALMLPLAAALGHTQINIWGCDGGPAGERSRWSPWKYFGGGEPSRDSATRVHPAFFRDRVFTEQYYNRYMQHHRDYFETLLKFFEEQGLSVHSRTPSAIPALRKRFAPLEASLSK